MLCCPPLTLTLRATDGLGYGEHSVIWSEVSVRAVLFVLFCVFNIKGLINIVNHYIGDDDTSEPVVGSMIRPLCSQLQMKVVTSAIFKGKKDSYPQSITRSFLDTRIGE